MRIFASLLATVFISLTALPLVPALAAEDEEELPLATSYCTRNLDPNWWPPMPDPCRHDTLPDRPVSRQFIGWIRTFAAGNPGSI